MNGKTPLFHTTFHKAKAVAKLLEHHAEKRDGNSLKLFPGTADVPSAKQG